MKIFYATSWFCDVCSLELDLVFSLTTKTASMILGAVLNDVYGEEAGYLFSVDRFEAEYSFENGDIAIEGTESDENLLFIVASSDEKKAKEKVESWGVEND